MNWADIGRRAVAVFFPERCVLCGEVVAYDDLCCDKCRPQAFDTVFCGAVVPGIFSALSGFVYGGDVRQAVLRLKREPHRRTVDFFADAVYSLMQVHWEDIVFDYAVPVPINPEKRKERGFNQAELLAAAICRRTGIPLLPDALLRHDKSGVQHHLGKAQRGENAAKSYGIGNADAVRGKTVLLVDDVLTTGATLSACADLLLGAGALRVYAGTATAVPAKEKLLSFDIAN